MMSKRRNSLIFSGQRYSRKNIITYLLHYLVLSWTKDYSIFYKRHCHLCRNSKWRYGKVNFVCSIIISKWKVHDMHTICYICIINYTTKSALCPMSGTSMFITPQKSLAAFQRFVILFCVTYMYVRL